MAWTNNMKVAIAHSGPLSELVIASSVNLGIRRHLKDISIAWVVPEEHKYVFEHNKNVSRTFSYGEFWDQDGFDYDLLINLWPAEVKTRANIKEGTGFGFYNEFDKYEGALLGTDSFPEINNMQLYFYLAGMTWKGEGYDMNYYPRTKTKKSRIGMSAANANLRNYVIDNLEIDDKTIWHIPYKKNIFKKMDEINRCKKIITDDLLTLHLALALRKYVYYLETYPHTLRLELFKNGQVYPVPYNYLK